MLLAQAQYFTDWANAPGSGCLAARREEGHTPACCHGARARRGPHHTVVTESLTDDMGMRKSQVHLDMFPKEVIDDVKPAEAEA